MPGRKRTLDQVDVPDIPLNVLLPAQQIPLLTPEKDIE